MIDARRLAQIGIFLYGLSQLSSLITATLTIGASFQSEADAEAAFLFVPIGYSIFILSLLFLSGGWAALVNVPGTVSRLSEVGRDDLLRTGVPLLGLYFLISGVATVVGSAVASLYLRCAVSDFGAPPLERPGNAAAFIRAIAGAALVLWGTNVVALIQWARALGGKRGSA